MSTVCVIEAIVNGKPVARLPHPEGYEYIRGLVFASRDAGMPARLEFHEAEVGVAWDDADADPCDCSLRGPNGYIAHAMGALGCECNEDGSLRCTCEWGDDGDGESGPRPWQIPSPDCSEHGRVADPEGWAMSDEYERGHIIQGAKATLHHLGHDTELTEAEEAALIALHALAGERLDDGQDDGWDHDRASGVAAYALALVRSESTRAPVSGSIMSALKREEA